MIRAHNLTRQFDKRGIAGLHNLSLNLEQGKVMAIMGPNGSGKTTLLRILAGTLKAEAGSYSITGDVATFPSEENPAEQNVQQYLIQAVKLNIDREKKIQLARDLADTFEFTFQLRQRLSELSSGQKQKILLASQLINRPALLLMDEPFAHLDPFTRKDILKGLFKYIKDQNITVLWVTHDLEEALQFSDVIGLMNFGKFEQVADPLSMIKNPKNLFTAKFMGYRNFFSISFEQNVWKTPWGDWQRPGIDKQQGLLIIPDHAWRIGEGRKVKILDHHAGKQVSEYLLELEHRKLYLIQGSQLPDLNHEHDLEISPIWNECLQIPL